MLIIIIGQWPVFITGFLASILSDSSLRRKEVKMEKKKGGVGFNILKEMSGTIKILQLTQRKRSDVQWAKFPCPLLN